MFSREENHRLTRMGPGAAQRLIKEGFFQQVFDPTIKELQQKRQTQAF